MNRRPDIILPAHIAAKSLQIIDGIVCDHQPSMLELYGKCANPPMWAPRIVVPSKTQMAPGHKHLHLDMKLHYCAAHHGELKLDDLLAAPAVKPALEKHAKRARPIDFKCDFDAAHLVYVSIFSPEYKYFEVISALYGRDAAQERWGAPIVAP